MRIPESAGQTAVDESARALLWDLMQQGMLRWFRFRRDVPIGKSATANSFVSLSRRVAVEIDVAGPDYHRDFDAGRVAELQGLGYKVLRFWAQDVLQHPDAVVDQLCRECTARSQYLEDREVRPRRD